MRCSTGYFWRMATRCGPRRPRAASIIARHGPRDGKVGLVIGGGSGPRADLRGVRGRRVLPMRRRLETCSLRHRQTPRLRASTRFRAVQVCLFMYGNYAGDVMNFDMAAEMAAMDDIEVRTVLTTDDVASAPRDERRETARRGGKLFHLQGGGRGGGRDDGASTMWSAWHGMPMRGPIRWAWRSAPVRCPRHGGGISTCPRARWKSAWAFMASPGSNAGRSSPPDQIVDEMMDRILDEMACGERRSGRRSGQWSGGHAADGALHHEPPCAGAASKRRVWSTHATWVGNYCTSLEMAGASVTLMHLDDELQRLIDRPCQLRHVPGGLSNG